MAMLPRLDLAMALARCDQLEVVIYERRGLLGSEAAREAYRADFRAVRAAVEQAFASAAPGAEDAA